MFPRIDFKGPGYKKSLFIKGADPICPLELLGIWLNYDSIRWGCSLSFRLSNYVQTWVKYSSDLVVIDKLNF